MSDAVLALLIGLVAGYLSGQFGIGGGIITTPAIRLLLGRPELVAVGTPLPVIVPTAVAGALAYARRGLADTRLGLRVGLVGGLFTVAGAWLSTMVGGRVVLLVTAALIAWVALDMAISTARRAPEALTGTTDSPRCRSWGCAVGLGAAAGLYSGFLGLGGGFVVVPALIRYFGFSAKRAIGTSLVIVSLLAVPGSIAHHALGNVDLSLAALLTVGVVPGALLGARVTARAQERSVRLGFAALLVVVAVVLAYGEVAAG